MSDFTTIDFLKLWISVHGFADWDLEDEFTRGTYGLVFFLNAKNPNTSPKSIALKTLDPEDLPKTPKALDELQREFAMWLRLPDHENVLRAGILKRAKFPAGDSFAPDGIRWVEMPVMQMARMDGCLSAWIGSSDYSLTDKLSALAQAFNGLTHLYANGIEGHGDLKPSNLLFTDNSRTRQFPSDAWLKNHPWIIKVADLGWANAWIDYGYTSKAHRPYVAPERLGDHPVFIPEKSDMFSMGMIAAELIQGHHPSPNFKKAEAHDSKWLRQIDAGKWNLEGISPGRIKDLIERCIDPDPAKRPSATEAIQTLCQELREVHGVDIGPTLDYWTAMACQSNVPSISSTSEEIERLARTLGLGVEQESKSFQRLRQIFESMNPKDIYSLEDWVQAAGTILDFLKRMEGEPNEEEAGRIRSQAREHLEKTLSVLDHPSLATMASTLHSEDRLKPFERFSHLVGNLANIANIDFEQAYGGEWNMSQLTLAGFAYHMSTRSHSNPEDAKRDTIEYLDIAVDLSLIEAVPYYFRAIRKHSILIMEQAGFPQYRDVSLREIIDDLEMACRLAPDWQEPRTKLESIRKHS
jgi:serine/threonine protein kinase